MNYLLRHRRAVMDSFRIGHSASQIGFMMHALRGTWFPWFNGGVVLFRAALYPTPGAWQPVGIAQGAATQIRNYPGMTHFPDQAYLYTAATMLGNGMISSVSEPVRIEFDDGGNLIQPLMPNPPVHVVAGVIAGGKFRVVWEYGAYGHGASPTDFQVFEGATPATVDYDTALTDSVTGLNVVAIEGMRRVYRLTTPAYTSGTNHVFVVRSRNANGVAEKNTTATTVKQARSVTPPDVAAAMSGRVLTAARRVSRIP